MKFTSPRILFCILIATFSSNVYGQSTLLPLSQDLNSQLGQKIYFNKGKPTHSALLPYVVSDLDSVSQDSLLKRILHQEKRGMHKNWLFRKIFLQHLVEVKNEESSFYLDFLPDMQIGREGFRNIWLNTRGIELGGTVGKKFSFTSHLFENQAVLPTYQSAFANSSRVIPGQGYARPYGNEGFDFGYSGGRLSYTPTKYLNLQLGYDKNFIGDGYRSLFLSDNSFNYPFIKATATLGSVRFMTMWAQFIDFQDVIRDDVNPFPKKYGIFHYLSWNATKRLSLGLFENIMWAPRGFEFSYVNPLMVIRPTEFANASPDKAVIGLSANYKIADRYVAYSQLIVNEFVAKEVLSRNGSWLNKQGVQLGIKGFDIFKVKNLNAQLEMNSVRPYTYSARDHTINYGHYGQALAHPYGANFKEYLSILNYRYQRFNVRLQLIQAKYGLDTEGGNYGKDIYKSYLSHIDDYGVYIGHGLKTNLTYADAKVAYILNPKNNLRLELGYTLRKESNAIYTDRQNFFNIGLRSSFRNVYSDF